MQEDLRLKGTQFEWLLTAFYITYISFTWLLMLYVQPPLKPSPLQNAPYLAIPSSLTFSQLPHPHPARLHLHHRLPLGSARFVSVTHK